MSGNGYYSGPAPDWDIIIDGTTYKPFTTPIKEINMEPQFIMSENALDETAGYSVELGGQRFTQAQWEAVQQWHRGAATAHLAQLQNQEFHDAMNIFTAPYPRAIPAEDVAVVIELIREEFIDELIPALGVHALFGPDGKIVGLQPMGEPNVVEIYDASLDILYVVYGLLNRAGMNAKPGYDEVQASNMSKLGEDGQPIIAGPNDPDGIFPGRVKKGPNYFRPNLARILREQGWTGVAPQAPDGSYDDHQDH